MFENLYPIPKHVERCGKGYCCTAYNAWEAQAFINKWEGWNACRTAMLQSAPVKPVPDEINTKQAYQYMRSNSLAGCYRDGWNDCRATMLQSQPVSKPDTLPVSGVTAEHQHIIEMLLKVCGAAFELADDTCEQEVDGEQCHVVPHDAFQKLSDTLDEIENSLPTEDADRPDVYLAWAAMPRAALKSLLQSVNSPVSPDSSVPEGRDSMSHAIKDVIAERERQRKEKGYTENRDDKYLPGVLNLAGAAYAVSVSFLPDAKRRAQRLWPWPDVGKYMNPSQKEPRTARIKSAALIIAEVERIDRAAAPQHKGE